MAERPVELTALIARLPASTQVNGDPSRLVTSLAIDSRKVRPGACFVALRGEHRDGLAFVPQAVAKGALAVVFEDAHALDVPSHVTAIHVPDTRRALSTLASAFYGDPSLALDVIGITGTNGKTTAMHMICAVLQGAGRPCGTIGTVGAAFRDRTWPLANTTPPPPELHALLAAMRAEGAAAVAMEVSSHALALDRVEDVRFRVAALTNVTRDHLDFHATLDDYAAAKHRLFTMAQACVINLDDGWGARWYPAIAARVPTLSYALRAGADILPSRVVIEADGSRFEVGGTSFRVRLPGRFNVENALAAIGVGRLLDIDDPAIARGLAELERVPGRMECLRGNGIEVVVDYAHTPDALESALGALRETARGSLAVVFGCGGDRDRGKRALMGSVAARLADRVYVTSDNPRSEDPQAIAGEIVAGMGQARPAVELDRRVAIERAIAEARAGDVVLVAGKGHETYQIVGERIVPFDDAAIVRNALHDREATR